MQPLPLYPVGQRPQCLFCARELRPNFKWVQIPYHFDPQQRKQWRKDHPREFKGTYGSYGDNRFCGLTCGHSWAVRHSKPELHTCGAR